jgi:Domain of unknown function (DUF4037)
VDEHEPETELGRSELGSPELGRSELGGAELGAAELGGAFHQDLVGPLIRRELPRLRYAAARLGSGSDVLGLDDATSRDHDWGLRLTVLVDEADRAAVRPLTQLLDRGLPEQFRGRPIRFATTWDAAISHRVEVATVADFAVSRLGVNPLGVNPLGASPPADPAGLSSLDWLVVTGQSVLEVTAGPVYADSTTELAVLRRRLAWYPADVERYVLACGWQRLCQRLPYVGRTGDQGQPLQSRLLSAGLVSDLVSLAFLLHRRWEPYEKWREALFVRLPSAAALAGPLGTAIGAADWPEREAALAAAVEVLAAVQRRAGLPTPAAAVHGFFDRPYRMVAEALPQLLLAGIGDPALRQLVRMDALGGSVSQWVDSVDVLAHPPRRTALTAAYRNWLDDATGRDSPGPQPPG